jgi:hypothetical protein
MNPDLVKRAPLFEGRPAWEARKVVVTGMLRSLGPASTPSAAVTRDGSSTWSYSGRLLVVDSDLDGHERTLAIVDAGGVFGETGMVADGYRTFSARAESPAEILQLDFDSLERCESGFRLPLPRCSATWRAFSASACRTPRPR